MPDPAPRPGLDAVPPRRVPSLPGRGPGPDEVPEAPAGLPASGSSTARIAGLPAERAKPAAPPDRALRPREFRLDKGDSDWVDTTALAIRLASDSTAFDRSALVRGILRAVRESDLDLASNCTSEEEVAAHVRDLLRKPR